MRVTQIEPLSKNRSKVYIEQELAFVLYRGELRRYHVQEGEELSEEAYRRIMEEVLPKRARLRAMNLLKSRDYTAARLQAKLQEGLYPPEAVQQALEYAASFHYIDDLRYAREFITCYSSNRSRRRLEQDLQRRGVDRQTIQRAFREWEEQGGAQDEQRMIAQLLQKRHYDPKTADIRERQRTYAFLARRGFAAGEIQRAMGSAGNFDEETSYC